LFTSASSAETPAPVADALEPELAVAAALALLGAAEELLVEPLGGVVELLDEHAARSIAAATAMPPKAARATRGFRLLIPSMRPRINVLGVHRTLSPQI
jgi:hypothetical protein